MLERLPAWIGALLRTIRAGHAKLAIVQSDIAVGDVRIDLSSPGFANGGRIPPRFTADGEGVSPPLTWGDLPAGTASVALLVEDADAPAPHPLVHALVWNIDAAERGLAEGAIGPGGGATSTGDVGRNSFLAEGWLPPDPPPGHGSHDYVFQIFALSEAPHIGSPPGRGEFLKAIAGRVLAAGMLVGTYSRDEPASVDEALGDAQIAGS